MKEAPTIALAMIVKGIKQEAELLEQCLENINKHVDAIYLNINHAKGKTVAPEIIRIANKYEAVFFKTEWQNNFAEARNFIFDKVPKDYQFLMWLDSDDTVDHPEKIKQVIARMNKLQQGVYIKYDYDHDEVGNVTLTHLVARVVRNNGSYIWKSGLSDKLTSVHETLNEVIPREKVVSEDFKIIHHASPNRRIDSLIRNIKLLEGMFKNQEKDGKFDPRTLFYLGTHYFDARNFEDALTLLNNYLVVSGWSEERCEALVYIGNIYRTWHKDDDAHRAYLAAIGEFQNAPAPYIGLAELDFIKGRYEESEGWIDKCVNLPPAPLKSTIVQRPIESTFKAYLLGAQACVNLGGKKLNKAKDYIKSALESRPLDKDALDAKHLIDGLIEKREDVRAAVRLVRKFESEETDDKIIPFINSLPFDVQDNPIILNTRHRYSDVTYWGDKTVAIYVGQGPLGIWGPWSLDEGIGGSEEAVIKISRELSDLGWNVSVYATPGEHYGRDGDYNVTWKQYYEFNPKDEYNVLVAWRNPSLFDVDITSKKKYLWLHDVIDKEEFLPERVAKIDKVIFVGQYHADLYKDVVPDKKRWASGNGISPEEFVEADGKFERQPHRMVYMSAYNRGLRALLDSWDEIKTAVPDATLDVYYGWGSYDALNSKNPERMKWKTDIIKKIDSLDGVTDHGKISHKQIIEEINKADIFAYSCVFPEVYCISYVKAMAGGAMPVTSNFAELAAYKGDGGIQVPYKEGEIKKFVTAYTKRLIKALRDGTPESKRKKMAQLARDKYSWAQTAKSWSDEFAN